MQQAIFIDEIRSSDKIIQELEVFEIEWFETQKHLFKRGTNTGLELHLQKEQNSEWQQNDLLYSEGKLIAQIHIKEILVIQFISKDANEIADFSFYIGNRHLPLFVNEKNVFSVPYDGNLYEQLKAKFPLQIVLEKTQLLANNLIKRQLKKN